MYVYIYIYICIYKVWFEVISNDVCQKHTQKAHVSTLTVIGAEMAILGLKPLSACLESFATIVND